MRKEERTALRKAKLEHNQFKRNHPEAYREKRDAIANQILTSRTPRWGGLNVILLK
jgi:hypothetical protein